MAARQHFGNFGTKQEYLRRVVYPQQNDYQATCGSIARCGSAATEVEPHQELAYREQQGRGDGTYKDVAPFNTSVWQHLVDCREQNRDQSKRCEKVQDLQDYVASRQHRINVSCLARSGWR